LVPPLVPIPLGGPLDRGQQQGGAATRGGAGCNNHGKISEYVVQWWR
ncbi:hypothetical protein BAE44_0003409, partial [Dichanthelium oligosanthes]